MPGCGCGPGASQAAFTACRPVAGPPVLGQHQRHGVHHRLADAGRRGAARGVRPEAVALTIFAGLAALIALVVLVQFSAVRSASRRPSTRSCGRSAPAAARWPRRRWLWVGVVTLAGGLLGTGIAIVASPLMPIGPARLAEPSPGIAVDLAVLGAGLAVTVLVPMLLVLPSIWRAAGPGAGPLGVAEPPNPGRASRLGSSAGPGRVADWRDRGPDGAGAGTRPDRRPGAQRAGRDRRRGTAVVASAVFGASLLGLVGVPHRYGQNWTQSVVS